VNKRSRTPKICRIDQPKKHNHGYFVRLQRRGKIHSAFFSDKQHGGRRKALVAAQAEHHKMLAKFGLPVRKSRRWWAELPRRKGSSNVIGVQRLVVRRDGRIRNYWKATWSPEPYVVATKVFRSIAMASEKPSNWPSAPGAPDCGA
jgi:hypothetical protein